MPNNGPEHRVGAQYNQPVRLSGIWYLYCCLWRTILSIRRTLMMDIILILLDFFLQCTWRLPVVVYVIPVIYTNLIQ